MVMSRSQIETQAFSLHPLHSPVIFPDALPICEMEEPMFSDPVVSGHLNICSGEIEGGSQSFSLVWLGELKEQASYDNEVKFTTH